MITVRCTQCAGTFTVPDEQIGTRQPCPHCRALCVVGGAEPGVSPGAGPAASPAGPPPLPPPLPTSPSAGLDALVPVALVFVKRLGGEPPRPKEGELQFHARERAVSIFQGVIHPKHIADLTAADSEALYNPRKQLVALRMPNGRWAVVRHWYKSDVGFEELVSMLLRMFGPACRRSDFHFRPVWASTLLRILFVFLGIPLIFVLLGLVISLVVELCQ